MQPQQRLFESIFKRNFADPGNKAMLEEVTAAHPYFSPAQFYLLQQTTEGTEVHEKQAGRANIFFNNPLWLNLQISRVKEDFITEDLYSKSSEIPVTREPAKTEEAAAPEIIPVQEIKEAEEILSVAENRIIEPGLPEEMTAVPEITEPVAAMSSNTEITASPSTADTALIENSTEAGSITTKVAQEENPVLERYADAGIKPATEPEIMHKETTPADEKNLPDELPLFEPMHMVDYFASQGIKLSEEAQTADKLGKQLKSFTEWLKTMKKVHATSQPQEGVQSDQTVEAMAEMSNQQNEVITEAMAEVFARQGKTAKATEVYQKLSLLNPAKSAYFAAKIDNLKGA